MIIDVVINYAIVHRLHFTFLTESGELSEYMHEAMLFSNRDSANDYIWELDYPLNFHSIKIQTEYTIGGI